MPRNLKVLFLFFLFVFWARGAAQSQMPVAPPEALVKPPEAARLDPLKEKITLDYKDTDLATILRSFSYTYGLNLVTAAEVKGKITVSLRDVTLAEALDVVLTTNGYNYSRRGNIIYITPGSVEGAQLVSEPVSLNYLKAGDAQNLLRKALSPKGDIKVDEIFNILVVTDYPANIEKLKDLLASVDHPPQQVLIEAKIVDITSKDLQNLGVTWQIDYNPLHGLWGRETSYSERMKGTGTFAGPSSSLSGGQLKLDTFVLKGLTASATIDALIQDQKANLLASPSIAVLNNREARIIIGEKVPYKERTQTTTGTTETTKFVDVGTTLRVLPSINSDGYITMTIHPEVSSVSALLDAGPRITTREADTMVRVKEGETIVIGGLIKQEDNRTRSRLPVLGYIPFFGNFFGNRSKDQTQTELTVFITPKILRSREEMYQEGRSRYQEEAFVNILATGNLNMQKQLFDKAYNLENASGLESRRKDVWQLKNEALSVYESIVTQFPDGPKAAEAGYRAARIYYRDLDEPYRARELCAIIISAYPNDPYASDAKELYRKISVELEKERINKIEKDRRELSLPKRAARKEEIEPSAGESAAAREVESLKKAKLEAERQAQEAVDAAKRAKQEAEAAKKAREEVERKAKEDAERKAKDDTATILKKAKEESKLIAKEKELQAREETKKKEQLKIQDQKLTKEQGKKRALEEKKKQAQSRGETKEQARLRALEEKKAREEAARQARQDAEIAKTAKEQARLTALEEKRKQDAAREEARIKALEEKRKQDTVREEARIKALEEKRQQEQARQEAQRKAKEEVDAARKAKEEVRQKALEEKKQQEQLRQEAQRRAKEEADAARKTKEEARQAALEEKKQQEQARQETLRQAREKAEGIKRAQEQAKKQALEEKKAREDAARKAKLEAEAAEKKAKEQARLIAKEKEKLAAEEARRQEELRQQNIKIAKEQERRRALEEKKRQDLLRAQEKEKARLRALEEQKAKEEAARKAKLEAEAAQKAKEDARLKALLEKKQQEQERLAAERRAKEKAAQLKRLQSELQRQAEEKARQAEEEAKRKFEEKVQELQLKELEEQK